MARPFDKLVEFAADCFEKYPTIAIPSTDNAIGKGEIPASQAHRHIGGSIVREATPRLNLAIVGGKHWRDPITNEYHVQRSRAIMIRISDQKICGKFLFVLRHEHLDVRKETITFHMPLTDKNSEPVVSFPFMAKSERSEARYVMVQFPNQGRHLGVLMNLKQENTVMITFLVNNSSPNNHGLTHTYRKWNLEVCGIQETETTIHPLTITDTEASFSAKLPIKIVEVIRERGPQRISNLPQRPLTNKEVLMASILENHKKRISSMNKDELKLELQDSSFRLINRAGPPKLVQQLQPEKKKVRFRNSVDIREIPPLEQGRSLRSMRPVEDEFYALP